MTLIMPYATAMDSLPAPADTNALIAYKGVVVGVWVVLLLVAERLAPAVERQGGWGRVGRNISLFLVNTVLSRFAVIPLTAFAATVTLDWRPEAFNGGWWILVDLVILDFWIYWWHRANHTLPFLWRFHEIHHLDEFLDVTSATRFHAGEVLLSAAVRAVVIILLDIPLESVLAFEAMVLIASAFQHSNLRIPVGLERAISWVFVTPSIHWVHHHAVRRDTDSNYANTFSLWDRLFGTRSPTPRTPSMKIGAEGAHDRRFLGLLGRPVEPR